jgi:hypothetical protein
MWISGTPVLSITNKLLGDVMNNVGFQGVASSYAEAVTRFHELSMCDP